MSSVDTMLGTLGDLVDIVGNELGDRLGLFFTRARSKSPPRRGDNGEGPSSELIGRLGDLSNSAVILIERCRGGTDRVLVVS